MKPNSPFAQGNNGLVPSSVGGGGPSSVFLDGSDLSDAFTLHSQPAGTQMEEKPDSRPPVPSPPGDPAASLKRVRRERRAPESAFSAFRHRGLWLAPLLAETVLLLGAIWLTICLDRVIWTEKFEFPILSFLPIIAVYVALVLYSRARELFMPRAVVLIGVGTLTVLAVVGGVMVTLDGFLLGGLRRLATAFLVLVPLCLFLIRCVMVFREARFAPTVTEHFLKSNVTEQRAQKLREKMRFWMN